jgi:phage-related protein
MHFTLTEVVTELTGTAGLTVLDGDVDKVLNTVVTLLTVVLKTVDSLVTILGLTPQLNSLLHSVFSLLAQIITLVTGLVGALVPGLVAALSPLLAALGNGLLAPLLTPIVAVVAGLAVPGVLGSLPLA